MTIRAATIPMINPVEDEDEDEDELELPLDGEGTAPDLEGLGLTPNEPATDTTLDVFR